MEHNGYGWTLAQQLEEAFNQVGASMLSDEFACKLLAFTYVLGGEITVLHKGLNAGIAMASQKFNIKGGETPHARYLPLLNQYIREMEATREDTPWIQEIYDRYQINQSVKNKKNENNQSSQTELFLP